MQNVAILALPLVTVGIAASCAGGHKEFRPETIVALERAALDRWRNGDPQGYLETFAADVTYFDQTLAQRVDGLEAMKEHFIPIVGKVKIDHYEMIGTKVQHYGDVAVLSFNLVSYTKGPNGESRTTRWNSTEVYGRIEGKWVIVHSHWSYTKPEVRQAGAD